MTNEKIKKMLGELKEEEKNLRAAIINGDTAEARMSAQEALDKVREKIADMNEILAELDKPAEPAPAAPDGEGARSISKITETRGASKMNDDKQKIEERANTFVKEHKTKATFEEMRNVLLATGTLAKPTKVGGINEPFNTVSSLVDQITVEDMTGVGTYKEAYVKAWQSAGAATDGTASTASDPTFRTAQFTPFLMDVLTYVSREIRKQTPLQYEEKVRKGALIALRKKVNEWIVTGNGTAAIYGIYNAVNTESAPEKIYDELALTGQIGADTLRKIVFAYGGDENVGGNARLYLNKTDLIAFGDVRGTNEKKTVYEITPDGNNPNTGIIKDGGLSVPYTICSNVVGYDAATATSVGVKTMIYGDPSCYKLGLHGDFEVRDSEDYKFAEGLIAVRGEVMVSGNLIADKGMLVVLKKTASGS